MIRFTIRDVLWLTVLASVLVAWWVDDSALRTRLEVQAVEVKELKEAMANDVMHVGPSGFPGSRNRFSGFPGGSP